MLVGKSRGVIVHVEPWDVHDQRNWKIAWRPEGAADDAVQVCHLAVESVYPKPAPGDAVEVDLLMGQATEIRRSPPEA
ncbi:MAG: hypothetical protein ACYTDX_03745 [Planctomycetota bacterium]